MHLLSVLQDSELLDAGIDVKASGWRDRLPIKRLDETSLVHRMFGGYFRSQILCNKCGHKSNTYDPFLDLALEIDKKTITSVQSALKMFTKKETLDKHNMYKCSGCSKRVCAVKQLTVFRPPLVLCIQLKRFKYSSFGMRGGKVNKRVNFTSLMTLALSDTRVCEYTLTGVLVHVGGSVNSGHYYSYVKAVDGRWFEMDDSSVRRMREEDVVRQVQVAAAAEDVQEGGARRFG